MPVLIWAPDALVDLICIEERFDAIDPTLTRRVVDEIVLRSRRLARFPLSAPLVGIGDLRKLSIRRYDYVVLYRLTGDDIEIVRVRHAREDWRPR